MARCGRLSSGATTRSKHTKKRRGTSQLPSVVESQSPGFGAYLAVVLDRASKDPGSDSVEMLLEGRSGVGRTEFQVTSILWRFESEKAEMHVLMVDMEDKSQAGWKGCDWDGRGRTKTKVVFRLL